MDVLRITPRGFCHGVVDAIRLANEAGAQHQGPVYMLGYLVHNAHVVNELAENGVQLVDYDDRMAGLDRIEHGTVILTAHGVSPAVKQRAIDKGLTVIDATCSDVYITHDLIIDLTSRGYEIIYVGKRGHPEPDGAIGEAPGHVHLVSTPEDVAALDLDNDLLAVTTQTTLSIWDTQDVIDAVVAKYPQVEVHNDICLATQDRQEAAVEAAEVCDLVIVVGSDRSSNSHRLVEVVRNVKQTPAFLVDSADDVDLGWFKPGMRVGVTAGASTPARVTRQVIELIEAYEPEPEPVAVA
ncbi:MAG: 4-hydroxy-3-methylbut-2-enyl diphosphate reductase [Chloroflexi bacterium]|nr:4-hydroxy-3-methylbut-2-enyl diphosphate reductase [Chloroflexota bacterium]